MTEIKKRALFSILWSAIERFSAQIVQFFLGIVLARLLLPSDYGMIGIVTVVLAFADTLINSGFSSALIQKKGRDELDYSTIFIFNSLVSIFIYLLILFLAPYISNYFRVIELEKVIKVLSVIIIINSFTIVHRAKLSIELNFLTQTIASLTSVIISGGIGIYLAYKGLGVWALVTQSILRSSLNLILIWTLASWHPRIQFSITRLKSLFKFGSRLLVSGIINTIYNNINSIIIGRKFNTETLGYYSRSLQFSEFLSLNIANIIDRVSFPLLSEIQNEDERLKNNYSKILLYTSMIVFPLMFGMSILSEPIILLVLTDKWEDSIWMLRVLSLSYMFYPIHVLNLSILNVKGRSDLFLKIEIVKKVIQSIIVVIAILWGLEYLLYGHLFFSIISLYINNYYSDSLIGLSFIKQIRIIIKPFLSTITMGFVVSTIIQFFNSNLVKISIGTCIGAFVYFMIIYMLNIGDIRSFLKVILQNVKEKK